MKRFPDLCRYACLLGLLVACGTPAWADPIYRWTDADGVVQEVFSGILTEGALQEKIEREGLDASEDRNWDRRRVGQVHRLERRAERHRREGGGDPGDRGVEVVERVLLDERRNLGAKATKPHCLVCDHTAVRLAHTVDDRAEIKRLQRARIDDLGADAMADTLEVDNVVALATVDDDEALAIIRGLHPRPGASLPGEPPEYVIPDVFVRRHEDRF